MYRILVFLFLLSAPPLLAQKSFDVQLRTEPGLKYNINKKSSVHFSYRLDLANRISQFNRSNLNLSYNRSFKKHWEYQLYYRFMTDYSKDEHRFRIALSYQRKWNKKTEWGLRTMAQQDIEYFDKEYLQNTENPLVWRNRLKISRDLTKKIKAYIYAEPFIRLGISGVYTYRLRSGTGLNFYRKKWKFGAEYFYQNEWKRTSRKNTGIFCLEAEYEINALIKKIKSK